MQFEKWIRVDVSEGHAATVDLGTILYTEDVDPLKLGVEMYYGQDALPVEGTVSGTVITPNGTTLTLTGDSEEGENRAWVVIPETALANQGKVEIFVRIADDAATAVVLYAYAYVKRSEV